MSLPVTGMLSWGVDILVFGAVVYLNGLVIGLAYLGACQLVTLPIMAVVGLRSNGRRRDLSHPTLFVDGYRNSLEIFARGQLGFPGAVSTIVGVLALLEPLHTRVAQYFAAELGEPPGARRRKRNDASTGGASTVR